MTPTRRGQRLLDHSQSQTSVNCWTATPTPDPRSGPYNRRRTHQPSPA
jgi:hypothetical protein